MNVPEADGKLIFRDIIHLANMGNVDLSSITQEGDVYRYNSVFFTLDVQPTITILSLSSSQDMSKAQTVNVPFAALSSGDFTQVQNELIDAINKI